MNGSWRYTTLDVGVDSIIGVVTHQVNTHTCDSLYLAMPGARRYYNAIMIRGHICTWVVLLWDGTFVSNLIAKLSTWERYHGVDFIGNDGVYNY